MNNSRLFIFLTCLFIAASAHARDDRLKQSIADAMGTEKAKGVLNQNITFKFGSQSHGKVQARYGQFTSNKKTSAFGKSAEEACSWAFLSAMSSLQDRAQREGGNAVINITSFYKGVHFSSTSEYDCGKGNVVAGVSFKGDVVKLAK